MLLEDERLRPQPPSRRHGTAAAAASTLQARAHVTPMLLHAPLSLLGHELCRGEGTGRIDNSQRRTLWPRGDTRVDAGHGLSTQHLDQLGLQLAQTARRRPSLRQHVRRRRVVRPIGSHDENTLAWSIAWRRR